MTRTAKRNHFGHHLEVVTVVSGGPLGRGGRLGVPILIAALNFAFLIIRDMLDLGAQDTLIITL
jgi:hypothetical protein